MRGKARPAPIRDQYDELLRLAGSLKRGWVPASHLLSRLSNTSPQTPLATAISEYGRITRTNFLLGWCADPTQRARVAGQLNKGESLHAMRRHLVVGSRAQLPAHENDHRRHALCLQLLVNAIQVWNARYMTAAIDHLRATQPREAPSEEAIARLAPDSFAHVNSIGRYDLTAKPPPDGRLRPLRQAPIEPSDGVPTPPLGVDGDKH